MSQRDHLSLEIEGIDGLEVPQQLTHSIAGLLFETWGSAQTSIAQIADDIQNKKKDWAKSGEKIRPQRYVIQNAGTCVAHAWIEPRTILTQKGEMIIAGLGGVCVSEALQGKGLGTKLIQRVFEDIDHNTSYQFSVFSTEHRVRTFYERLGAHKVTNRFIDSTTGTSPFWGEIMMVYPKTETWPTGEIDMRGPGY